MDDSRGLLISVTAAELVAVVTNRLRLSVKVIEDVGSMLTTSERVTDGLLTSVDVNVDVGSAVTTSERVTDGLLTSVDVNVDVGSMLATGGIVTEVIADLLVSEGVITDVGSTVTEGGFDIDVTTELLVPREGITELVSPTTELLACIETDSEVTNAVVGVATELVGLIGVDIGGLLDSVNTLVVDSKTNALDEGVAKVVTLGASGTLVSKDTTTDVVSVISAGELDTTGLLDSTIATGVEDEVRTVSVDGRATLLVAEGETGDGTSLVGCADDAGMLEITGVVELVGCADDAGLLDIAGVVELVGCVDDAGMLDIAGVVELVSCADDAGLLEIAGVVELVGCADDTGVLDTAGVVELVGCADDAGVLDKAGVAELVGCADDAGLLEIAGVVELVGSIDETTLDFNGTLDVSNPVTEDVSTTAKEVLVSMTGSELDASVELGVTLGTVKEVLVSMTGSERDASVEVGVTLGTVKEVLVSMTGRERDASVEVGVTLCTVGTMELLDVDKMLDSLGTLGELATETTELDSIENVGEIEDAVLDTASVLVMLGFIDTFSMDEETDVDTGSGVDGDIVGLISVLDSVMLLLAILTELVSVETLVDAASVTGIDVLMLLCI